MDIQIKNEYYIYLIMQKVYSEKELLNAEQLDTEYYINGKKNHIWFYVITGVKNGIIIHYIDSIEHLL